MDDAAIEAVLAECERELAAGRAPDLRTIGFWRAVNAVKRRPELVARHADRIGEIDRQAFRRRIALHFPAALGVVALVAASVVGVVLLALAPVLADPWDELAVLLGAGALIGGTHNLAHVVVGTAARMRFTDWFMDLPKRPHPGMKVDYATYLRASPRSRAWMHAAGAIVTKIVPFTVALYGLAIGSATWAVALLVALGLIQLLTDAVFSVKSSDWKKFRREMRLADRGG